MSTKSMLVVALATTYTLVGCSAGGGGGPSPVGGGARSNSGGAPSLGGALNLSGEMGFGGLGLGGGAEPTLIWQYGGAFKDPSLPDEVRDLFEGAASSSQTIVYPFDASMHPMNLGDITFQWSRSSEAISIFRIDAAGTSQTWSFYVPCQPAGKNPSECTYQMPAAEWLDLGDRNRGSSLTFSVSGSDGKHGPVETSAPIQLSFSPDPVLGGIYYWSTALHAIKRANFGSQKAVPFISPASAQTEFGCVACHSVSRDGSTIAFAVTDISDEGVFLAHAIQTAATDAPDEPYVRPTRGTSPPGAYYPRTPNAVEPQDQFGDNVALSPDGSVAFVNGAIFQEPPNEKYAELRDTKTGERIAVYPAWDPLFEGNLPIHPEWSPDGSSIAVTLAEKYGGCQWTFFSCKSSIAILPYDKAARTLGKAVRITQPADGLMDFYPTWSPDGRYLAFVSAPMPPMKAEGATDVAIGSSSGNQRGVLRLVEVAGAPHTCPSANCFELTRGTTYTLDQAMGVGEVAGSTWPKFTPFAQGPDHHLMFISFTSRAAYGYLGAQAEDAGASATQLWMFAVDLTKLGQSDASSAPIWLPYQDLADGSLTPFWTEVLPCSADADGGCKGCAGGEQCIVDNVKNTCQCSTVVK